MDETVEMQKADNVAAYNRGVDEQRMIDANNVAVYNRGVDEQRMIDSLFP